MRQYSSISELLEDANTWMDDPDLGIDDVERFISQAADEWASLGDASIGPGSYGVLVRLGDEIAVLDWDTGWGGEQFVYDRFSIYSAAELVGELNRVAYEADWSGMPFIIRAAAEIAVDLGGGRWLVAFDCNAAYICGPYDNPSEAWELREFTPEESREFTELRAAGFPAELIAAAFGPAVAR